MSADRLQGDKLATSVVVHVDDSLMPGATPQQKAARALSLVGGLDGLVQPGDHVLVKPNIVAPFAQATTSLDLLDAAIQGVREAGAIPFIAESAGFEFDTAATFQLLGLDQWAGERDVELVNLDKGPFVGIELPARPFSGKAIQVAQRALEADAIINLPKLKRHNYTGVTLGLKNLMGLLSRDSRRLLHALDLEMGIAALAVALRPRLTLLDALTSTSRAVYGSSQALGAILAGRDPLATDWYACRLLGQDPARIRHLALARELGLGQGEYSVLGSDPPFPPADAAQPGLGKELYRLTFRGLYLLDRPLHKALGHSIIPAAHYWLGLRPHITRSSCTHCGLCAEACLVGAIDTGRATISSAKCMRLRCLRCLDACPEGAISVRGFRRPSR